MNVRYQITSVVLNIGSTHVEGLIDACSECTEWKRKLVSKWCDFILPSSANMVSSVGFKQSLWSLRDYVVNSFI